MLTMVQHGEHAETRITVLTLLWTTRNEAVSGAMITKESRKILEISVSRDRPAPECLELTG